MGKKRFHRGRPSAVILIYYTLWVLETKFLKD
jgi:hypothetical protein